jgi:beta-xylosidase
MCIQHNLTIAVLAITFVTAVHSAVAKNPIDDGWYADPEAAVFGERYWVFPTTSARYDMQLHFDAFSSPDLVSWTMHERILTTDNVKWARRAMWAPCCIEKGGKYYLFFSANDLQRPGGPLYNPSNPNNHTGGIGVAVADTPAGPYNDFLGKPLLAEFVNDAQPIDQFVYRDDDGTYYFYYGGWRHCNVGRLKPDFTGFVPFDDGELFREITPRGYVEGPVLFKRNNTYYFMWSQGGWGNDTYHVAYGMADSPLGPFKRIGIVLESDRNVATGAGHNSIIQSPSDGQWYIVYHRRPIPNKDRDHRVTCIDKLEFANDGTLKPVRMTFDGVAANPIRSGR